MANVLLFKKVIEAQSSNLIFLITNDAKILLFVKVPLAWIKIVEEKGAKAKLVYWKEN